ncbi:hypothetical protein NPIL_48131 [Nephila pilipes]|uniref:Uncharacterized protein n=1 Tax=Nephila pilipes TaxID=299642 RepID=A0A8X6MR24_NEPPI|nr:hypothetical protein NPIL_48131 [Nephila pilipes]
MWLFRHHSANAKRTTAHSAIHSKTAIRTNVSSFISFVMQDSLGRQSDYSPNLNSCDFKQWSFLKNCVYQERANNKVELKAGIGR